MGSVDLSTTDPSTPLPKNTTAQHIRGSSLLLAGRVCGVGLEFLSIVLLVRYLSKEDFGALSYALAVVVFFQQMAMFEMGNTLARFVPLYRERGQRSAIVGAIAVAVATVVGLGALIAAGILAGIVVGGIRPTDNPEALRLLIVLAALIPLQGLDGLFTPLFAAFGASRAILLRQSVLGPGLKLASIATLIGLQAEVTALALGHLMTVAIGVLIYAWMFGRLLSAQGLLAFFGDGQRSFPVRDLFGFATPMLASQLAGVARGPAVVLLLGYFQPLEAVAAYQAVVPIAELGQLVIYAFTVLYVPLAAGLYAKGDITGSAHLYRQTALWVTVLSFPVFVLTCGFALPVTTTIFGSQYADAAPVLAVLSLGSFVQTCSGFNGLTLKVFGRLRYSVTIDVLATVVTLGACLLLIPRWGALGAAVATAGTHVAHNLLKQYGLRRATGITLFDHRYAAICAALLGVPLLLLALQAAIPVTIWVALPLAAAAALAVLWASWGALEIGTIFPELRRWPVLRRVGWRPSPEAP